MPVKRRNHGRNKHGRGHVNRVRWARITLEVLLAEWCEIAISIYRWVILSLQFIFAHLPLASLLIFMPYDILDVHQPERPFPRTRPSSVLLSAISLMPHHFETLRMPLPTRNISFPNYTLRCTTALRQLCISVLYADVPRRIVGFAHLRRGSRLRARNKYVT